MTRPIDLNFAVAWARANVAAIVQGKHTREGPDPAYDGTLSWGRLQKSGRTAECQRPLVSQLRFDASELSKTARIVKKFSDHDLTLADAHGLAIMRELRIGCCWSTDLFVLAALARQR